jgi:Multiubiquitin
MSLTKHHHNEPPGQAPEVELIEVVEIIDIEEHCKNHGTKPPKARHYKIRVDREKFTVDVPCMTGREILTLAGKTPPEHYLLNQKFKHGHVKPIGLEASLATSVASS